MFDYDQLALNVPNHNTAIEGAAAKNPNSQITTATTGSYAAAKSNFEDNVLRRLSGDSNDTFDSSASSGYGSSCTGTPLASPALLPTNFIAQNLQKMLSDCEFNDPIGSSSCISDGGDLLSFLSGMKIDSALDERMGKPARNSLFSNNSSQATPAAATPTSPAVEDGFSTDEIAQFAQLLSSPKKNPPPQYQCHICFNNGHYISDCPMRFNSSYEELTPYQGRKKCYGEFTCHQCKRRWTSQNSVANEAQNCIKCSLAIFPHKQLPVDKAVALGLVKAQRTVPTTKLAPIGSGRVSVRQ